MNDSFEAKGKRKKLVAELRKKGITDEEVLRAIDTVPRHLFMDPAFLSHAYVDKAFPIYIRTNNITAIYCCSTVFSSEGEKER